MSVFLRSEARGSLQSQYIKNFQKWQSLEASNSNPGEYRNMRHLNFFRKFNSEQLLYEAIFDLIYSFCNILPRMNTY